ncbi:PH (Pleckstrin Homology) domain-containing protein [Nocardioides sp. J9]|uniref:PH domain-containing protein n=1 Tax=unclassified Nocardioides TaxID=2615069 RepID=UPI0004AFD857|nr:MULTISPECIES: PH domain-containing protein [unclassified Nocardioides]TWH00059.1 PH (Pleckstrin Homology) domain-containing protein [Nocardioides sp. J9]
MTGDPAPAPAPALPRTWRPLGPRIAAVVFGAVLVGGFAWLWVNFDPETQASVNIFQKGTVIGLVLLGLALLNALARSRVVADEAGLTVVNGYRRRRLTWAEVGRVRMPRGAPWPFLEQDEDERIALMGIHSSDGQRAAVALRELRAVVAERTDR